MRLIRNKPKRAAFGWLHDFAKTLRWHTWGILAYYDYLNGVVSSSNDSDWDFFKILTGPGDTLLVDLEGSPTAAAPGAVLGCVMSTISFGIVMLCDAGN